MGRHFYFLLAGLFYANSSLSYPTPIDVDGALHRWPVDTDNSQVYYEVIAMDSSASASLQAIVDESAEIWSSVDGSLLKLQSADENNSPQITVYYDDSIQGGATSAGYSVFDEVSNGVPKHCTIHIAMNSGVDAESLSKTTLHELGHCIGLGHSLMPQSIMSYSLDQNTYALSVDDRAALVRIYPSDGGSAHLAPGCSVHGNPRHQAKMPIFIGLLILPLLVYPFRLNSHRRIRNSLAAA